MVTAPPAGRKTILRPTLVSLLLVSPLMAQNGAPGTPATTAPTTTAVTPASAPGSPGAGRDLFTGAVRFKNGGPPCGACHTLAGLDFPGGGTMGPDLTRAYAKFGPEGLNSALETLYFPAMTPLFAYHPLTPDERRNLAAFIQSAGAQQPGAATAEVAGIALLGLLILVAVTAIAGRNRHISVRKTLLRRARLHARTHP